MDSSNTRGSPKAQVENPPRFQVEKFCLKINLTEDKYKIKFKHNHNRKSEIHAQELALAFVDVLTRTTTNMPIDSTATDATTADTTTATDISPVHTASVDIGSCTGTTYSSGIIVENQKLNAEVLLLRQRNQELEGNVGFLQKGNQNLERLIDDLKKTCQTHERKLTQLSELSEQAFKANKDLIEAFRAATHAKAGRLASQYDKFDTDHAKAIDHGHKHALAPVASSTEEVRGPLVLSTSEKEPEVFMLNPKLKEIDFFNLEDLLGRDGGIHVSSERMVEDFSTGNDEAVAKTSNSIAGTSFDDNETSLGDPSTRKFEFPKAAPPTILKAGLDVGIARAGGVCKAEMSYGSPIYRHHRARDLPRKIVSYAEHEDTVYADDDLPGHNLKIVDVTYNPSANNGNELKGVIIGNLPQDINYEKLLAKVRGGTIVSATLCDTRRVAGCARRMSALIVFINSESARLYVEFARKHGIFFKSERAVATLIGTPTYPLSVQAQNRIECNHHTRYFMIREDGSNLDLVKIIRIINFEVNEYRKEAVEKAWKDEHGNIRVLFASISAASNAHWRLTKRLFYDPSKVEFQDDPCGGPLTDLLPHGKTVDSTGLKLNYGDEGFDDKIIKDIKSFTPTVSKIINDDEIDLEDGDFENAVAGNKRSDTECNKGTNYGMQEMTKETPLKDLDTAVEKVAESIVIAKAPSTQGEDSKQISEITKSDTIECSFLTSSEGVSQLQKCLGAEASIIFEDNVSEETNGEGTIEVEVDTITPTTPESSRSSSEELSSATTRIIGTHISSAEAAEKPGVKSAPSPQTPSPHSEESSLVTTESPQTPNSDIAVIEEADTKSTPSPKATALEKFSLDGTDLDPVLLPRYVLDTVLAAKPRGGLSSSRWADPDTEPAAPIIIKAPDAVPLLSDALKPAYELLFGIGSYDDDTDSDPQPVPFVTKPTTAATQPVSVVAEPAPITSEPISQAPANAPKGPRAGLPNSRWASTQATEKLKANETTAVPALQSTPPTGPKFMPRKPRSKYINLRPDNSRPRSTLRSFYSDVDSTAPKG